MSLAQGVCFLLDVVQMAAIALVSVIINYHINGFASILRHCVPLNKKIKTKQNKTNNFYIGGNFYIFLSNTNNYIISNNYFD